MLKLFLWLSGRALGWQSSHSSSELGSFVLFTVCVFIRYFSLWFSDSSLFVLIVIESEYLEMEGY